MEGAMFQHKTTKQSSIASTAGKFLLLASLALFLGGCESDSPTAPSQSPAPPATSGGGGGTTGLKITITASPSEFELGEIAETGNSTSQITVTARRNDNNASVPANSTALLTTSAGTLTNLSGTSGLSIPVTFDSLGRAQATLAVPTTEALTLRLRAQIESSFGDTLVRITEDELVPLFIESVSPSTGPPAGGTLVNIRGTGFEEPIRVNFGDLPGIVQSSSSTRILASTPAITLPAGQTSTVGVTVMVNVNDPVDTPATDSLGNAFTYARGGQVETPTLVSLSPTSGPNEGGTQVTIFGEGFANDVQVFFGTGALIEAPVLNITPTRLLVRTPSATGPNSVNQNAIVNVRVVNTVSGASDTLNQSFQYGGSPIFISAAGPNEGIYLGGTVTTIFGQGFVEPVVVEFGGVGQQEISVTGTEIVARSFPVEIAGCNRPSGNFRVVNVETGGEANSGIPFVYRPVEPSIFGISPSSVTVDVVTRNIVGSDDFSLNGFGFDRREFPPRVTFGDVTASGIVVTDIDSTNFEARFGIGSTLEGNIPPFTGNFDTETCDSGGVEGERFVPTLVPVMVENLPTDCTDTVNNFFSYVPSDTSCRVTAPANAPVADFNFQVNNLTVSFTDTSTEGPTSWSWTFGDGNSDTVQNPTHTYPPVAATYSVTLTATNGTGSDSITRQVVVTPLGN